MFTSKFKKGDKVRFVRSAHRRGFGMDSRDFLAGKVLTIKCAYGITKPIGYEVEESELYWFSEDELELAASVEKELNFDGKNCVRDPTIKNRTAEIRFCIDPKDKKDAHRIAHEAVDSAIELYEKKKGEEWTPAELVTAKYLFAELVADLIKKFDGNYIRFDVNEKDKHVRLIIAESEIFPSEMNQIQFFKSVKVYHAFVRNNDQFNEKIGKIVCVCKALGRPIPVFIRDKNRRIEGDWIL